MHQWAQQPFEMTQTKRKDDSAQRIISHHHIIFICSPTNTEPLSGVGGVKKKLKPEGPPQNENISTGGSDGLKEGHFFQHQVQHFPLQMTDYWMKKQHFRYFCVVFFLLFLNKISPLVTTRSKWHSAATVVTLSGSEADVQELVGTSWKRPSILCVLPFSRWISE